MRAQKVTSSQGEIQKFFLEKDIRISVSRVQLEGDSRQKEENEKHVGGKIVHVWGTVQTVQCGHNVKYMQKSGQIQKGRLEQLLQRALTAMMSSALNIQHGASKIF